MNLHYKGGTENNGKELRFTWQDHSCKGQENKENIIDEQFETKIQWGCLQCNASLSSHFCTNTEENGFTEMGWSE
jgi:hypothetical protein